MPFLSYLRMDYNAFALGSQRYRIAKKSCLYHNKNMNILCVCLSSTIQRTLCFDSFALGDVNRTKIWREDASGKALNASRVLNQLESGSSIALCPVGNKNSDHFMDLVSHDDALHVHPIYIEGKTRTCWTLLDDSHASTTEVIADEPVDPYHLAGAEAEIELLEAVKEYMQIGDALLFAGSRPAQWSANICARICEVALKAGKIVLADFWGKDLLTTLQTCTPQIIKINNEEYCATFAQKSLSEEELIASVTQKSKELHNIIIVTRGTEDTIAADDGTLFRQPIEKLHPVNTTACGDSFAAGFLNEYLKAKEFSVALKAAAWCAARNAQSIVPGAIR